MTARLAALVLAGTLLLSTSGCDLFGPSGPGTLEATVTADEALGALVLELEGGGVQGVEGRGDTRVYGRTTSAEGLWRVVLVAPDGGEIRFGIQVADLGSDSPLVRVVSAVGPDNRASNARGIQVRVD